MNKKVLLVALTALIATGAAHADRDRGRDDDRGRGRGEYESEQAHRRNESRKYEHDREKAYRKGRDDDRRGQVFYDANGRPVVVQQAPQQRPNGQILYDRNGRPVTVQQQPIDPNAAAAQVILESIRR